MSSDVLFTPATDTTGWRINGDRLWASLMDLAQIGATPKGGCRRLTLTDLDRQGRDKVIGWAREAGMSVTIDKIGNVFMRREGRNPGLPPIVSGSHIDTQPTGGKFDGNYGVLAALEVVRTLNDLQIDTDAPRFLSKLPSHYPLPLPFYQKLYQVPCQQTPLHSQSDCLTLSCVFLSLQEVTAKDTAHINARTANIIFLVSIFSQISYFIK